MFATTVAHKAAVVVYWGFMLDYAKNGTPFLDTPEYAKACDELNLAYQARRDEVMGYRKLRQKAAAGRVGLAAYRARRADVLRRRAAGMLGRAWDSVYLEA
jgi:hypothetical protein